MLYCFIMSCINYCYTICQSPSFEVYRKFSQILWIRKRNAKYVIADSYYKQTGTGDRLDHNPVKINLEHVDYNYYTET